MGAYYTKQDITEYISKNTIIPYLFDAAKKKCAIAFQPDGALWRLLRDAPDRYIYPAVCQGVLDEQGNVIPLPADIAAGLDDVARRDGWNRRADAPYALPTETWREHVARRRRCLEVREKLRAGEVHDINDLVTLNLDIWRSASKSKNLSRSLTTSTASLPGTTASRTRNSTSSSTTTSSTAWVRMARTRRTSDGLDSRLLRTET